MSDSAVRSKFPAAIFTSKTFLCLSMQRWNPLKKYMKYISINYSGGDDLKASILQAII